MDSKRQSRGCTRLPSLAVANAPSLQKDSRSLFATVCDPSFQDAKHHVLAAAQTRRRYALKVSELPSAVSSELEMMSVLGETKVQPWKELIDPNRGPSFAEELMTSIGDVLNSANEVLLQTRGQSEVEYDKAMKALESHGRPVKDDSDDGEPSDFGYGVTDVELRRMGKRLRELVNKLRTDEQSNTLNALHTRNVSHASYHRHLDKEFNGLESEFQVRNADADCSMAEMTQTLEDQLLNEVTIFSKCNKNLRAAKTIEKIRRIEKAREMQHGVKRRRKRFRLSDVKKSDTTLSPTELEDDAQYVASAATPTSASDTSVEFMEANEAEENVSNGCDRSDMKIIEAVVAESVTTREDEKQNHLDQEDGLGHDDKYQSEIQDHLELLVSTNETLGKALESRVKQQFTEDSILARIAREDNLVTKPLELDEARRLWKEMENLPTWEDARGFDFFDTMYYMKEGSTTLDRAKELLQMKVDFLRKAFDFMMNRMKDTLPLLADRLQNYDLHEEADDLQESGAIIEYLQKLRVAKWKVLKGQERESLRAEVQAQVVGLQKQINELRKAIDVKIKRRRRQPQAILASDPETDADNIVSVGGSGCESDCSRASDQLCREVHDEAEIAPAELDLGTYHEQVSGGASDQFSAIEESGDMGQRSEKPSGVDGVAEEVVQEVTTRRQACIAIVNRDMLNMRKKARAAALGEAEHEEEKTVQVQGDEPQHVSAALKAEDTVDDRILKMIQEHRAAVCGRVISNHHQADAAREGFVSRIVFPLNEKPPMPTHDSEAAEQLAMLQHELVAVWDCKESLERETLVQKERELTCRKDVKQLRKSFGAMSRGDPTVPKDLGGLKELLHQLQAEIVHESRQQQHKEQVLDHREDETESSYAIAASTTAVAVNLTHGDKEGVVRCMEGLGGKDNEVSSICQHSEETHIQEESRSSHPCDSRIRLPRGPVVVCDKQASPAKKAWPASKHAQSSTPLRVEESALQSETKCDLSAYLAFKQSIEASRVEIKDIVSKIRYVRCTLSKYGKQIASQDPIVVSILRSTLPDDDDENESARKLKLLSNIKRELRKRQQEIRDLREEWWALRGASTDFADSVVHNWRSSPAPRVQSSNGTIGTEASMEPTMRKHNVVDLLPLSPGMVLQGRALSTYSTLHRLRRARGKSLQRLAPVTEYVALDGRSPLAPREVTKVASTRQSLAIGSSSLVPSATLVIRQCLDFGLSSAAAQPSIASPQKAFAKLKERIRVRNPRLSSLFRIKPKFSLLGSPPREGYPSLQRPEVKTTFGYTSKGLNSDSDASSDCN